MPDATARATAVAALKKEFREEFRSKDPAVLRTLAGTLLDRSAAAEGDPVARYVLLEQAAAVAEDARDVRLALDAVGRLAGAFQVDAPSRGFASVDAVTRGAKETAVLGEAANACIDICGDALAADDAATAGKAIAAAAKHAKAAKLTGLASRANALADLVAAFRRGSTAAAAARTALVESPDDPVAHATLGRFLCFGSGDWESGLPHLVKSGEPPFADLAARELESPTDAAARLALAESWWSAANKDMDPLARARMLARAGSHYEAAAADTPAERRAAVSERLGSITYRAWNGGVALTKDFSKDGPVHLALAAIRAYIDQKKIDREAKDWRTSLPPFPEVVFAPGVEYLWHLDTNQGAITIRFFPDTAPKHVANFLYLTELGFFDGLLFHRVIPDFMAQGGCPKKDGSGGPGYTFEGEFAGGRKHDRPGILSMANTGMPKSDGSQFFITFTVTAHLDGKHTVFGEVVEGMDVVKKLEAQGTPGGRPRTELVLEKARVSAR